jgi:hypothetical protein
MTQLTFLWAEPHANRSVSRDFAKEWMIREETSRSPILQSLTNIAPDGWFGRTSPASCPATVDGTLVPSSGRWANSGLGSHIECLTLSTSEWPSDAAVCLLSDTLETGDVPQRFYLSAKACQGILRRAEKRGKKLPSALQRALEAHTTPQPKPCL